MVGNMIALVSQSRLARRLAEVGECLKRLREDLAVTEEQCLHFDELAEDARIRALVSETPFAEHQHREAARHAQSMARHKVRLREDIQNLEAQQDLLLDKYSSDA